MTTMNIENQVCDAIQILAERAINQAPYDKTIAALIVECVDTAKGKYKVKYQDALYYATSDNTELNYRKNTEVYILIPGNDFSKEKKILGTVKDMEEEYRSKLDEAYPYYEIGNSISCDGGSLCSYKTTDEKIFSSNLEDKTFIDNVHIQGDRLRLSAEIQTALPPEHRVKGSYGITATLEFIEEETGKPIDYTFTLDIDSMIGNPYAYGNPTLQKLDFEIDGTKFKSVKNIKIFSKGFVEQNNDTKQDNIFISNIKLSCLSGKEHKYIKIEAPDNYTLKTTEEEKNGGKGILELRFRAVPMIGNKEIFGEDAKFYWFSEDGSVNVDNINYSSVGGKGWNWISKDSYANTIVIKEDDQLAEKLKYKCVCILNGRETYKQEFSVIKTSGIKGITLKSIPYNTTEFIHDRGKTTLECLINGEANIEDYIYYWSKIDNEGVNTLLDANNGDSEQVCNNITNLVARGRLESFLNRYNNKENPLTPTKNYNGGSIEKETLIALGLITSGNIYTNEQIYNSVVSYLNDRGLTCINNNVFYDVRAKNIIISNTYKCTIIQKNTNKVAGCVDINLTNIRLSQDKYTLKINNGTQVFKYDGNGRAPRDGVNEAPATTRELSVSLYDNNGNEIDSNNYEIRWIFPPEAKSLLKCSLVNGEPTKCTFTLVDTYNTRKVNNDIEVQIIYKGEAIKQTTDFTFIKEGFAGTNGTDYYCKIVPTNGDFIDGYVFITYYKGTEKLFLNINGKRKELTDSTNPFKIALYNNGNLITGELTSKKWRLLLHNLNNDTFFTPLEIRGDGNGTLSFDKTLVNNNQSYVGVIQVEAKHDNRTFYAELPIGFIVIESGYENYELEIKEGTGFNEVVYTSDGTNPQYASAEGFTVQTTRNDEDGVLYLEESSEKNRLYYIWNYNSTDLTDGKIDGKTLTVKPVKHYEGVSTDIYVKCQVCIDGNSDSYLMGTIYFPILFRLNRFGFAALNNWDGKSIDINNEGGYVMSPQVGAGEKDDNNRFTGVLIGATREYGKDNEDEAIGLLGFNKGNRTIFLDAKSGDAHFGKETGSARISLYGSTGIAEFKGAGGAIILDPSKSDEGAVIKSDNYNETEKTGLKINFSKPYIKFGSGKFEINSEGEIKSTAGSIGGWTINTTSISSQPEGKKLTLVQSQAGGDYAFVTGADSSSKVSEAPFYVKHDGSLKATKATIEGVLTAGNGSKIGPWTISDSAIYKGGGYNSATAGSAYFGNNGFSILNKFVVDSSGNATVSGTLTAGSNSKIGNWTVTNGAITNGKTSLNSDGSFTSGNFSVNTSGVISATGGTFTNIAVTGSSTFSGALSGATGTFGPWTINSNGISSGDVYIGTNGFKIDGVINALPASKGGSVQIDGNLYVMGEAQIDIGLGDIQSNTFRIVNVVEGTRTVTFGYSSGQGFTSPSKLIGCSLVLEQWGTNNTISATHPIAVSSDERIKNLYSLDERYDKLFMKLKPILYQFKNKNEYKHIGFSAQQVKKAMDECQIQDSEFAGFVKSKNIEVPFGESTDKPLYFDEFYSLAYEEFIPLCVRMIQKQQKEIDELKEKLGDL